MFTNITVESLLAQDHVYRKMDELLDLIGMVSEVEKLYGKRGAPAISVEKSLRMMLIQFLEDYSDRQMECAVRENIAVKWFCRYELTDGTPDHSHFGRFRDRLGTQRVAKLFNEMVKQIKGQGFSGNVFHFVDASAIVSKTSLWKERDEAIRDGQEKLNNLNVKKYGSDRQARFGCKGKDKYWFGYKRSVCVDTQSSIIEKVAVTSANVTDAKAMKHVCPREGMVLADKGYATRSAQQTLQAKGCHSGVILKNNMLGKDHRRDTWLTGLRMPYEYIFSKLPPRARYRGQAKVQFQAFLEATAFNLRRWVRLKEQRMLVCATAQI